MYNSLLLFNEKYIFKNIYLFMVNMNNCTKKMVNSCTNRKCKFVYPRSQTKT